MPGQSKPNMTRYERVRQILENAAGESRADYGGVGRFWNLPWAGFLRAKVYEIPMIAPLAGAGGCCCAPPAKPEGASVPQPISAGRGDRSGLVKGLRGQAPFNGQKFPPLPWGGAPVAEPDIQFIADWIDDGCPEKDRIIATLDAGEMEGAPEFQPVAGIDQSMPLFAATAGAPADCRFLRGAVKQRMNLDCLPQDQIDKLRTAFRALYELNKWPEDRRNYNNLALIHQNHCQHGWERFLPWHRAYLYEFEQALQDVCPGVTAPYWDWTMPQYWPQKPQCGWIIPRALQCFLTEESIVELQNAKPALPKPEAEKLRKEVVGKLFVSPNKFFQEIASLIGVKYTQKAHRKRFIDALLASNPLWYPLRYPGEFYNDGQPSTINDTIHYHYPTAEDVNQVQSLKTFRDYGGGGIYNDSFGFMDQNPHNTLHIWTGGMNPGAPTAKAASNRNLAVTVAGRRFHSRDDLYSQPSVGDMFSNLTASYDPIFWMVHVNVDRLWAEWQQANPNALPAGLDGVLTPWSYTVRDTLDISQFGYEYVKTCFAIPVDAEAPVSRMVSRPMEIPEAVRKEFRQAEVRLHRVPQLPRSCFIRIFLNLPGADAQTPLDHDSYAGYLAVFGHGPCYGGPGHCDPPAESPRKFDARPRSHNTPRNHRVNVTECARRLLKKGAKSLQITVVVLGADYREDKDLLRLEGVSLVFLD